MKLEVIWSYSQSCHHVAIKNNSHHDQSNSKL